MASASHESVFGVQTDNPFTPTFGVSPPLLAGRSELLEEFAAALEDGPGAPGRMTLGRMLEATDQASVGVRADKPRYPPHPRWL
jgi:hypothetical protein